MPTRITAYTDIRSPFTFVAKAEIYRWEEEFGVSVDWWPYTTPLEEAFGPAEGRNDRQLRKIKYTYMHVRRLGASQGLTIRGTRRIFDPTPAHVALLQAKDDGMFRAFHDLMFERVFRRELDPDDPDQVCETLRELDGDVESWTRRLAAGAAELDVINRRAEAQGVFGVPTVIFEGELFWGTDALPFLRRQLSERLCGKGRPDSGR